MKKINYIFAIIFTSYYLSGCSEEITPVLEVIDDSPVERSISFTTSMPVKTRIALEQDGNTIGLVWEEGDEIQLSFIQGDIKIRETARVKSISGGGKIASFLISVPEEIEGIFDLYGVYGGGGIDVDDPSLVKFPVNTGSVKSLDEIQDREDVMLYFSEKDLDTNGDLDLNVTFEHLGSLFSISIVSVGTEILENIASARLSSSESGWAFSSGDGDCTFNLVDNSYTGDAGNYLSFAAPQNTLSPADTLTFWGWYPPLPDEVWPELSLELLDSNGDVITTSINTKEARLTPTSAGKAYYFFAVWDNDAGDSGMLSFTDNTYNGITILTVSGQRFSKGVMGFYPTYLTDALLPNYKDFMEIYPLISLKDMKTYSMDYFAESIDNTANIDIRLSIGTTNDSRTYLRNNGTFNTQYATTDGTTMKQLEDANLVIKNETGFARLDQVYPNFDFVNATVEALGDPAYYAYRQYPAVSNNAYKEVGIITGIRTATTSTVGQRYGVIKEIARVDVPLIPGYTSEIYSHKFVVLAIRLF